MYQTIDYSDIMDHDYSEEDIKALRSLRRKFREEAQYEGSEEAEAAMNDIAEKVAVILKAKNEAFLETDESGNDEIEVNCDGEDCAELIMVSVDAEGPHYCCNCAPKYMKQENESFTEEKNSEKLFRKFPELRKSATDEVEEVITERGLLTRAELKALAKDSPVVEVKNGVATLKVDLKQAPSLEELASNAVESPQQLNIKVPDGEKVLLYKVVKPSKE